MKVKFELDYENPEDKNHFWFITYADNMWDFLWYFRRKLRNKVKYPEDYLEEDEDYKTVEKMYEFFNKELYDRGIDIDKIN